jgi:hypothetical protein
MGLSLFDDDECYYLAIAEFRENNSENKEIMEQEFKQGETVEISNDMNIWFERVFVVKHNDLFYCVGSHIATLNGWLHCRKPKQTVEEWSREWFGKNKIPVTPPFKDICIFQIAITPAELEKYYNDRKAWEAENQ